MMNSAQMSMIVDAVYIRMAKGQDKLHFSNSPLLNLDPDSVEQ